MRFITEPPGYDLTYNDVFMVPNHSQVASRLDVDLTSADGLGTPLPLVVANMTAISGRRMAETVARRGGIAIMPQDIPTSVVADVIAHVKGADTVFDTPVTVGRHTTVGEVDSLMSKRSHAAAVVVEDGRPVGLVGARDTRGVDRFSQAEDVMQSSLLLVSRNTSAEQIFDSLGQGGHELAIAVDDNELLVGVMSAKGALRSTLYRPALDTSGQLMVGTAVGINGDVAARAQNLLEAGADVLVIDTAHGHQEKMLESLRRVVSVRDEFADSSSARVPLVAGNVVTADGVRDLVAAGADVIKVGVGPGAMCTTRMQTGVGRPQFSAVLECAAAARELGAAVWADGGVRHPRDVSLALAAGAGSVMVGSWFAGTNESPGDHMVDASGRSFKESFGMASARAVRNRTKDSTGYQRARAGLFEEGISSSRMYIDPARPGVEDLLDFITSGLRSSCTYAGAASMTEFAERAAVGVQSPSGYEEGRPLHQSWA